MNDKLYITKKDILDAYKNNTLEELFNQKTKMIEELEKQKQAKRNLLDMLKNPSKIDMLLKMLQDNGE